MSNRRFAQALEMMRSGDPKTSEDGFDFLREHADAYTEDLIAAFEAEEDHRLRCWLLELVAEARSSAAIPVFAAQLESLDDAVRLWAVRGLEMLDTREAQRVLSEARDAGLIVS
jgi:hypothetical protein